MAKKVSRSPGFLVRAGQWLVYLVYRCFEAAVYAMPVGMCWRLGTWLGRLAYFLFPGYARLAVRNLTIAFGEEKGEGEIRALARRHFGVLGRNLLCSLKVTGMTPEELAKRVTYEGRERFDASIRAGKGAIAALCHLGVWELLAQVPLTSFEATLGTLFQPLRNPFLNARMRRHRTRTGLAVFDRKHGFHRPMELLSRGGGVGILVDQHAGDGGVWCPFFGRLASTTNIAALFSLRAGSPICPIGVYADGVGRWRIIYGELIETPAGAGAGASGVLAAEMNEVVERMVRRAPEEWFWVHNRWKTPKPKFLLAGFKRGVEFPKGFDRVKDLKTFNILVRSPNWLGDACMAVPAVRAIKRGRPDARITVLAPENLAAVWERVEEVDGVLTKRGGDSPWRVAKGLKGRRFDVGILLTNSLRTAMEMWLARIPRVVGYAGHFRRYLLDQIVPGRVKPGPAEHQAWVYLRIALAVGAGKEEVEAGMRAAVTAEMGTGKSAGEGAGMNLGICAGAKYGPAKRWHLERFGAVAERVRQRTGCEWVLFGGKEEVEEGRKLERLMGGGCSNLVGRTTMGELIERLEECRALLTNDTGLMHLAAFLGVPTVAIFGSTDPNRTRPLGKGHRVVRHHVECSPCFLRECPLDFRCMDAVEVEEVVAAIESLGVAGERAV